jgi:hypothetical protein
MKRILQRALLVLSGALLVFGAAGIGPAQAAVNLDGINVTKACRGMYGPSYDAETVGTTAYDWRCSSNGGPKLGVDMPGACHNQIGPSTVDRIGNFNDVNSWQCWSVRNTAPSGGLDLNTYCRSIGYTTATAIGSTAYDWRCVNSGGALGGIDTLRACRAQYGGLAMDRFRNFYDRNSWECWI